MTSTRERAGPGAELMRLLDTWGGDPERWPPHARRRIEQLCGEVHDSSRMLTEVRALDRLLDRGKDAPARLSSAAGQALADRIVAAALSQQSTGPRSAEAEDETGRVIQLRPLPQARRVVSDRTTWRAAGLMAASLLAGIYIGGSVNLAPVMQDLADAFGVNAVIDPVQIALGDDLSDEDAL